MLPNGRVWGRVDLKVYPVVLMSCYTLANAIIISQRECRRTNVHEQGGMGITSGVACQFFRRVYPMVETFYSYVSQWESD